MARGGRGPMNVNLDKAKDTKGTIKRLMKYFKGHKTGLLLVVIFIILYVILNLLSSVLIKPIIDNYLIPMVENNGEAQYKIKFIKMLILYILISFFIAIFSYIQSKIMLDIAQKAVKDMRKDLFEKIEKLPIKYFDLHPYGELMSRITNDIDNISVALNTSVNQIISGILTLIGTLIVMIIVSPILAVISIITLPIMLTIVSQIAKKNKKQFIKQQEALADVNSYIEEYISGQKVVKAFNKENDVKSNFEIKNDKLKREGFLAQAIAGIVMPIMGGISNASTAITAMVAGILAIQGKITIGTIAIYTKFSKEFSRPITEITNQFNVIQAAIAGAERMFEIIDEEVEFPENANKPDIGKIKGHVELKNVYFGYEKDEMILKDINIEAKPGQTIAIVGPTGAR